MGMVSVLVCRYLWAAWLAAALLAGSMGCASAPVIPPPPPEAASFPPPAAAGGNADQVLLKEALQGRSLSPPEVVGLSDRLLAGGDSILQDQETMARLERLLIKTLKTEDQMSKAAVWRNLGIIHYHEKKYKLASQELQNANEINPKNARTRYYQACLFVRLGEIYESQGKKGPAKQQFKRAAIELGQARKLEPGNPLYRQDPREVLKMEQKGK